MTSFATTLQADASVDTMADTDLGDDGAQAMIDILTHVHARR